MPSIGPKYICDWRRRVQSDQRYLKMSTDRVLRLMLVRSLSKMHQRAYGMIEEADELTTREIADKMHLSINNASNLCRHLFELGLVVRDRYTNDIGLFYKWREAR